MRRKPPPVPSRRTVRVPAAGSTIAAAEFTTRCLEPMDRVSAAGVEYVVTKHRKPVAKLVPYSDSAVGTRGVFGSLKGTVLRYERPFDDAAL